MKQGHDSPNLDWEPELFCSALAGSECTMETEAEVREAVLMMMNSFIPSAGKFTLHFKSNSESDWTKCLL